MSRSSIAARAILPVALLALLAAGCARAGTAGEGRRGSVVTAADIEAAPGDPLEVIVARRVPGVTLARAADGTLALYIRGGSSVNSANEPLYVLDGVPMAHAPGGTLSSLNRHEVASIEVLKDAASTAMYGLRGVNGVIVVTSKRTREPRG
jgi:TonB-dependent SusC/RagA subfamily outer membrane receptor